VKDEQTNVANVVGTFSKLLAAKRLEIGDEYSIILHLCANSTAATEFRFGRIVATCLFYLSLGLCIHSLRW
jgi:hypothetical protein